MAYPRNMLLLALSTVASGAAVFAQPLVAATSQDETTFERLNAYILGVSAAGEFSGVVLVAQDGAIVFERAYGRRDAQIDTPPLPDTRFDLASAGKMFTATAILQLIEADELTLQTRLGDVLVDYPNEAMRSVTIRQLLTHSAGAGETDALFYPDSLHWSGISPSVADFVDLYGNRPPEFLPGSDQQYSNHTMMLLGRVVEVLSKKDFRAYLAENIFIPAGMDAAHANEDCRTDNPAQAVAYVNVSGEQMPNCFTTLDGGWPAGGQSFSARDMLRFVNALRTGNLGVSRDLFVTATTPQINGFGLGFFATDYGASYLPRDLRWGHGGKLYGQCIDVRTYEATGETIITLGNNDSPACFRIAGFLHDDWRKRNSPPTGL